MDPLNVVRAEEFFRCMGMKIGTGSRYLGSFVGDRADEYRFLAEKFQGWTESVKTLAEVYLKQPYSAYSRLQKSLQQEWSFV